MRPRFSLPVVPPLAAEAGHTICCCCQRPPSPGLAIIACRVAASAATEELVALTLPLVRSCPTAGLVLLVINLAALRALPSMIEAGSLTGVKRRGCSTEWMSASGAASFQSTAASSAWLPQLALSVQLRCRSSCCLWRPWPSAAACCMGFESEALPRPLPTSLLGMPPALPWQGQANIGL